MDVKRYAGISHALCPLLRVRGGDEASGYDRYSSTELSTYCQAPAYLEGVDREAKTS